MLVTSVGVSVHAFPILPRIKPRNDLYDSQQCACFTHPVCTHCCHTLLSLPDCHTLTINNQQRHDDRRKEIGMLSFSRAAPPPALPLAP